MLAVNTFASASIKVYLVFSFKLIDASVYVSTRIELSSNASRIKESRRLWSRFAVSKH